MWTRLPCLPWGCAMEPGGLGPRGPCMCGGVGWTLLGGPVFATWRSSTHFAKGRVMGRLAHHIGVVHPEDDDVTQEFRVLYADFFVWDPAEGISQAWVPMEQLVCSQPKVTVSLCFAAFKSLSSSCTPGTCPLPFSSPTPPSGATIGQVPATWRIWES